MFEGLLVIELASVLAGPLTGSFFAELGATVIKIENKKTGGDVTRKWKVPEEDANSPVSAYYAAANYGKEVRHMDLTNPADYSNLMQLIEEADVVIVNYKPESAARLRLDYKTLHAINPGLIYASLTGYGALDNRPAFDLVMQAEAGYMSMTGDPDGWPCRMPVAMIDILAAHHMKQAVLCALIRRKESGDGQHVSVSLYDAAIASLVNQATNYMMAGKNARRMGSRHPNIAPYGDIFLTRDERYLLLAVGTDHQFAKLAELLGMDLEPFDTNIKRLNQRESLNELIAEQVRLEDMSYWEDEFDKRSIPFGEIKSVESVLDTDEAREKMLESYIDGQWTIRPRTAYI